MLFHLILGDFEEKDYLGVSLYIFIFNIWGVVEGESVWWGCGNFGGGVLMGIWV